jgi:hypothetical protein
MVRFIEAKETESVTEQSLTSSVNKKKKKKITEKVKTGERQAGMKIVLIKPEKNRLKIWAALAHIFSSIALLASRPPPPTPHLPMCVFCTIKL